ncbi:MAG: flagellar hook capping protein [Lachnospiraceae bacterium]|jgi:flagellar basal-body rod modification protein FlgD|nr:flagellar hook capping protein [Lachnospiraceae bacterium]
MAVSVPIVNGEVQDPSASANSITNAAKVNKSSLGKDAFLQLLVAQMKYQDPLEPTSNTEYISQLATFSELEEMQNLRVSYDMQRAQSLVGKQVIMNVIAGATGNLTKIGGQVDYVVLENDKVYLSIQDQLYSLDDLGSIVDSEYLTALDKAKAFGTALGKLPSKSQLTVGDKEALEKVRKMYDELSPYEKTFIGQDLVKLLTDLEKKMQELVASAKAYDFKEGLKKLPETEDITLENKEAIASLRAMYNDMTDFEKDYIDKESLERLEAAEEKIKELEGTEATN